MTYYLGREYMYKGMWEKCIETLKRHLNIPTAVWKEERCASMRWIAKSFYRLGDITQAYAWYYKAIAEMPRMRDPYVEFARMAYELADWPTVFYMTREALKIKQKSYVYVNMGYAWDETPENLCAIGCYRLGLYEESLAHAKAALSINPDSRLLTSNIAIIEAKLKNG